MDERRGFLVPVEVRFVSDIVGHGVFSLESVKGGTELWIPNLVEKVPSSEVVIRLAAMNNNDEANIFLRQGFVLAAEPGYLCTNVSDMGRFTSHSSNPNMGYADGSNISIALRDIGAGEELTCDYAGLGSPPWYKELCLRYGVTPTDEVVRLFP
jgi:SET domain-containing protein